MLANIVSLEKLDFWRRLPGKAHARHRHEMMYKRTLSAARCEARDASRSAAHKYVTSSHSPAAQARRRKDAISFKIRYMLVYSYIISYVDGMLLEYLSLAMAILWPAPAVAIEWRLPVSQQISYRLVYYASYVKASNWHVVVIRKLYDYRWLTDWHEHRDALFTSTAINEK